MLPISDDVPGRNPPVVTWLLILANGVVFLFELGMPQPALKQLIDWLGLVPSRVGHPELGYWPFLTSLFLHGGWVHILSNMWALWIFGDNVEDRMGPVRFLIFYLLCGVGAGIAHWFMNPSSTIPTIGASGAIGGVMGAYFVLFPLARLVVVVPVLFVPFFYEVPAILYLGFWALTQLLIGALALIPEQQVGGVAWWAHAGGFATGVLLVLVFRVRTGRRYRIPSQDEYGIVAAWRQ